MRLSWLLCLLSYQLSYPSFRRRLLQLLLALHLELEHPSFYPSSIPASVAILSSVPSALVVPQKLLVLAIEQEVRPSISYPPN